MKKTTIHPVTNKYALFAWAFYDWAHSAFSTVIQTFIFAAYFTRAVAPNEEIGTFYWGNAIGLAGLMVAILAPLLGAIADRRGRLKPLIALFTLLCAAATAGLWFVRPDEDSLWPALILLGIGTVGAQFALTFYHAMLPQLVPPQRQGLWSGWGWGLGYLGGLLCLGCLWFGLIGPEPLIALDGEAGLPVRAACLFTAVWLVAFTLPLLLFTPDRPGTGKSLRASLREGLAQLRDSLRNVREYAPIVRFLLAHMLYIDALAAVFAMGGVFAAGTFGMDARDILLFGVTLNLSAGLGAIGFAWVDHRLGSRNTVLLGLAGLLLSGGALIFFAQTVTQFWICGTILGLFVGPVQAADRAYLSQAAPEELRAQFFGLHSLAGKATSFVGPLLVGWVTHWTASQRYGMGALLILFLLGFLVLLTVPANDRQGKRCRSDAALS